MPQKGNLAVFEGYPYLRNRKDHAHQNWCVCTWHRPLVAWIFWANSDRLNFSTFMDHKLIFISETGETTPTKFGVHALDINPYLHKFFEPIPIDWIFPWPWTIVHAPKGKFGRFWRVPISPKPKRPRPPKLVCMHLTSIPSCMNFLSRFRSIEFFHNHGL